MTQEEFLINELARRAGTTVRTIRYYTDEGLLPQPEIHGKYAYYTQEHVDRLELIQRMKAAYLPLREIRQTLAALDAPAVRALLDSQETLNDAVQPERVDVPDQPAGASALDYIARITGQQAELRSPRSALNHPTKAAPSSPPAVSLPAPAPAPRRGAPPAEESWRRVSLAPGVELHLREPADSTTSNRVRQLIDFARSLFRDR
jgi:DNA-binding transcriptional MerR regulator